MSNKYIPGGPGGPLGPSGPGTPPAKLEKESKNLSKDLPKQMVYIGQMD